MARFFLLKAAKGNKDFFMSESEEFLYFYCPTLKDLRATLRCVTSKGFRVPKEQTLSKRIKDYNGHLSLFNPFFGTKMYEIIEIDGKLKIKKEFEYQNSFGFKHNLKLIDHDLGVEICKNIN